MGGLIITRVPTFVVPLLVCLGACSGSEDGAVDTRPASNTLTVTNLSLDGVVLAGDQWRYRAVRGSTATEIDLKLPMERVAPERFASLDKLGETEDGVVVIIDRHASRDDGRCADGREVLVHVLSLRQGKSLFDRLVASCIDRIAPPEPYASFDAGVLIIGSERFSISADGITRP